MRRAAPAFVAVAVLLSGCAAPAPGVATTTTDTLAGTVTVSAAASLTDTFGTIADAFTTEHPDVTVTFNFGGSSALAAQIVEGAPVDVFAAASAATMTTVVEAGLTEGEPTAFATNTLEIAVPPGNPGGVAGLADFTRPELSIALCAAEVPCGAAAMAAFAAAGIAPEPDTLEQDVKAVLTKVELGEVDAGLVYATDVRAAGDRVDGIEFAGAAAAVSVYPIARLAASTRNAAATAFVAYVLSPAGRKILDDAGFGAPQQ
ncbi:molybdate ABC transporter substrate-binding protein [Salinibacterium sp. G-O1]|uniref:molybdate ABC transporter substrate-binding protein n=1 Tax=Salinibacterium sp. G-O1 TaxID=3046208 RepID=UPI0024BB2CDA|nr:molybdate ABC transporter substrate-binding protein [Salinibacterium sp. G-O1]MDJ0335839.1 molybdate ABC transporter substrate-binding protein [Salinibacterium sp. G-O1]